MALKKTKSERSPVLSRKIVQSTQKQIPVKDITSGCVITADNRLVKIVEVTPKAFTNMKPSQRNATRRAFQNFISAIPYSLQIKSVSVPADLSSQIKKVDESLAAETNEECRQLAREYKNSLTKAQQNNIERKFYIAYSDQDAFIRKNKVEETERAIYRLNNNITSLLCSKLNECGNQTRLLNNYETAEVFYRLLNRNSCYKVPFEERYNQVYNKYLEESQDRDVYIPPTDLVAPKKISFNDRKFIVCDDKYYTFLYVNGNGFPHEAVSGWLDMFVNSYEGVDVDIFLKKKHKDKTKGQLRQTIGHVSADYEATVSDISDSYYNITSKYESAKFILNCIMNGQDVFDVSVMITVCGNTLEDVSHKAESLVSDAKVYDIILNDLRNQEEQAFISALPLNNLHKRIEAKAKRNMPEVTASSLYPFNTYQLIYDNGLYVANSKLSGSPVVPDFWSSQYAQNPHVFIVGGSGAGKTSAIELISVHARAVGIPVYIIAPEKQDDYRRLAKSLDGQFAEIGLGSNDRINIMDIKVNHDTTNSLLEQRIGVVTEFIHILHKTMSLKERAILNSALIKTYAAFGITSDNNSLYQDKEKGIYRRMPILEDLARILKQMGPDAKELAYVVNYLTTGSCRFFNGQTNVKADNKFFVIGLENNTDETVDLAAYLAEDFIQARIRSDRVTKSIFAIDEGWAMLKTESNSKKMLEDSKILRGYMCSLIFGTQQMADVINSKDGIAIMNNSATRIIMKHEDEDVKYISEYIDLTDNEKKQIREFSVGEALFLSRGNRLPIAFSPTEFEAMLTWNDPKTLKKYELYMQQKKEREKLEKENRKVKSVFSTKQVKTILNSDDYRKKVQERIKSYEN